jgi:hypothetical protein
MLTTFALLALTASVAQAAPAPSLPSISPFCDPFFSVDAVHNKHFKRNGTAAMLKGLSNTNDNVYVAVQ